jgi:hypothetical protein
MYPKSISRVPRCSLCIDHGSPLAQKTYKLLPLNVRALSTISAGHAMTCASQSAVKMLQCAMTGDRTGFFSFAFDENYFLMSKRYAFCFTTEIYTF